MSANTRRELLLAAAARVAARDGISELTTRSVAEEAGMPQGVFHYCFRSKDELLAELISRAAQRLEEIPLPDLSSGSDVSDKFATALEHLWRTLIETPGTQLSLYELTIYAVRTPGLQNLAAQQYAGYTKSAGEFLDRLAKQCGVAWVVEVNSLAQLLVATFDGLGLAWLSNPAAATNSGTNSPLGVLAAQLAAVAA